MIRDNEEKQRALVAQSFRCQIFFVANAVRLERRIHYQPSNTAYQRRPVHQTTAVRLLIVVFRGAGIARKQKNLRN